MPSHAPPKNGSTYHGVTSLPFVRSVVQQARRWARHALENSRLDPAYVAEKAFAAIGFTLRYLVREYGTPQPPWHTGNQNDQGSDPKMNDDASVDASVPAVLSIPTKLVGVAAVQPNVRALRSAATAHNAQADLRLDLHPMPNGITVRWQGKPIGRIQDKHAPWVLPLLPARASVHLIAVTGDETKGHTLGVNVYISLQAGL
jgi:hypothetical protein